MSFNSAWVPIKLCLSLFHPIHVQHINISTNLTRALNETFGKGQQTLWDRTRAIPDALVQSVADTALAFPLGVPGTSLKLPAGSHIGKQIREAWQTPKEDQTASQRADTQIMNEAGISAQLSEQLRSSGKRAFLDAWQKGDYLSAIWPGVKSLPGVLSKPIFEEWIPNLKVAAVKRETESLWRRRPDIMNDPDKRAIAMRAIGKQVDDSFGEMFYGNLFWNRTIKGASIGPFLCL